MKKIILILLMIGLCCGCQVNYQLEINKDLSVQENLKATRDSSFFEEYENSSMGRVVSLIIRPYLDTLNDNKYNVNNLITDSYGGVTINKKYKSLNEYSKNTILSSQFTDNIEYKEDGNKVYLSAKGKFSHSEQDQTKFPVNDATISITVPFKVTENNADTVDGNTYIWEFDSKDDKEREIKLVFNKEKMSDDNSLTVIIGILILIILVTGGLIMFKQFKDKKESANDI